MKKQCAAVSLPLTSRMAPAMFANGFSVLCASSIALMGNNSTFEAMDFLFLWLD